jgi:hypothetical protein
MAERVGSRPAPTDKFLDIYEYEIENREVGFYGC